MGEPRHPADSELVKESWFEQTDWSVVRKAGCPELPHADVARDRLCQTSWSPIYSYTCRLGYDPEEARDLTQEFFARVLARNYVQGAVREKGKFRTYLLTMLKRFLADQWDRVNRQKRGGGVEMVALDAEPSGDGPKLEPVDDMSPDRAFERAWACALIDQTLKRLEDQCVASGKQNTYREFAPLLFGAGEDTYATIAKRLQTSETNVKVSVHRLRQQFRQLLREEIGRTATSPEEVNQEIADLIAALKQAPTARA